MPARVRWAGGRGATDELGPGRPRQIRRFIEPVLLLLLHQGPLHGYGLISGLKSLGLEDYPIDPSAIYRILRDLEKGSVVLSEWDPHTAAGPPKRVYQITELGERMLKAWVQDLRETARVLQSFLDAYEERMKPKDGALRRILRRRG